jgi:two-component system cell cycle response regulator
MAVGRSSRPPSRRRGGAPDGGSTTTSELPRVSSELPRVSSDVPRVYEDHEGTATDQTAVITPKSFRTRRRATLMVISGSLAGNVIRLVQERTTIGRSKSADIVLTDEGVSRIHCIIYGHGDTFSFEDQRSTNGTIVNGRQVAAGELAAGDRIQLGSEAVLQFGYFDDHEEELAKKMYEGATRDPLTHALNRRHFLERFNAEISYATRHEDKLAAIIFDVDHFKSINDSFGHLGGDSVLKAIGATVGALLRTEDIFARYGGEEFVVIARGLSLQQATKLAERIRKTVEDHDFSFERKRINVSVSAGVAELAEVKTADRAGELLRLADVRLYAAKQAGRNRVIAK